MDYASAKCTHSTDKGEYCLTKTNHDCPPGCYCPKYDDYVRAQTGDEYQKDAYSLDNKGNGMGDEIDDDDVQDWCKSGKKCYWSATDTEISKGDDSERDIKKEYSYDNRKIIPKAIQDMERARKLKQCGTSNNAGVYRCPEDFPDSISGTSSIDECYKEDENGNKIFYNEEYYENKKDQKSNNSNLNCPAGFPDSPEDAKSEEECYKTCTAGHTGGRGPKIHNKKVSCEKGYFLPYEKETCKKCDIAGSVCPGVIDVYPSCSDNRGLKRCDPDERPNNDKTACEKIPEQTEELSIITVDAGYYLKKGEITQKKCPGATNYCPGGEFEKNDEEDQGVYKCNKGEPNELKTACHVTLKADIMSYGKDGSLKNPESHCWLLYNENDPKKYMKCVLNN